MRFASLFVVAALLVSGRASADDLRFTWRAPSECPSAESVRDAATRDAPKNAKSTPLVVDAVVERLDRWRVTLHTQRGDVSGERLIEASSCAAVADATAVVVALALSPAEAAEAPPPPEGPAKIAIGAAFGLDSTTLPSAAPGAAANVAFAPGRLRIEARGAYYGGQSAASESTTLAGANFSLFTLGGRGCFRLGDSSVEISPCLGADAQFVRAKGFGAPHNFDASASWLDAAAGVLVRVPLARWFALRGQIDGLLPLSRPSFVVEGDGAVYRPSIFGARGSIGAEFLFL